MQDYYEKYEGYDAKIDSACECINGNPSSNLKNEVEQIKESIDSLNMDDSIWGDSVCDGFKDIKKGFVKDLEIIIESISSSFKESEDIYRELQTQLLDLKTLNLRYQEKYKAKPSDQDSKYYHDETFTDSKGTTKVIGVFDSSSYQRDILLWSKEVLALGQQCSDIVELIEENKSKLNTINETEVSISNVNVNFNNSLKELEDTINDTELNSDNVDIYLNDTTGETIVLPKGLGNVHTYMGWQKVTNKSSNQYRLRELATENNDSRYDNEGFARIGDRYVVATTTTYGNVGDYIDVYQEDGTVIKAIIGDIKNQNDSGCNKWGHSNGNCVVEFVVDCNSWYNSTWKKGAHVNPGTANCHPEWHQNITKVVNKGSYFDLAKV